MQDEIDALTASSNSAAATAAGYGAGGYNNGGGGGGSWNITLADVCLRPLGSACATQSVLQYWGMSRDVFDHGALLAAGCWLLAAGCWLLHWPVDVVEGGGAVLVGLPQQPAGRARSRRLVTSLAGG